MSSGMAEKQLFPLSFFQFVAIAFMDYADKILYKSAGGRQYGFLAVVGTGKLS